MENEAVFQKLEDVADNTSIYLEENGSKRNHPELINFFNVMHAQFNRYTPKEREDFIVEYSQKSDQNLERFLLRYAKGNLPNRMKSICNRLDPEQIEDHRYNYYCKK